MAVQEPPGAAPAGSVAHREAREHLPVPEEAAHHQDGEPAAAEDPDPRQLAGWKDESGASPGSREVVADPAHA